MKSILECARESLREHMRTCKVCRPKEARITPHLVANDGVFGFCLEGVMIGQCVLRAEEAATRNVERP